MKTRRCKKNRIFVWLRYHNMQWSLVLYFFVAHQTLLVRKREIIDEGRIRGVRVERVPCDEPFPPNNTVPHALIAAPAEQDAFSKGRMAVAIQDTQSFTAIIARLLIDFISLQFRNHGYSTFIFFLGDGFWKIFVSGDFSYKDFSLFLLVRLLTQYR